MTDVFVSYAAADRPLAAALVEGLARQKWSIFWDRGIPAGKKWQNVLDQRLTNSRCVLVLLTPNSLKSSWVTYEASVALQRHALVPLLLDPEINPSRDLPEIYRDLHVASMPPDTGALRTVSMQEPWMKAIQALVSAGRRRRFLLVAAGVMFAVFALLASSYTALTLHDSIVEWESGIRYLERGPYSKAENERLKSAIRGATSIDFLAVNLNSSVNTFREDFTVFFQNPEHRMRVLFADPDSSFYKEAMVMTNKGIEGNTRASVADKGKLYFAQSVISGAAGDHPNAVEFREYDTQFRLPIILIDKKYCFMTVRLPPDLAQESIRVELASPSEGTVFDRTIAGTLRSVGLLLVPSTQTNANVETCERHFEEVWKYGKPLTAEPKEMPKK